MRKIILLFLIFLVLCSYTAFSADSTNQADYLFYEDAETGSFSTKWDNVAQTYRFDFTTTAYYAGAKSIRNNNTGTSSNLQAFVKANLWNASTASSPFCIDFQYKFTTAASYNSQCPAAIMFATLGESGFLVLPNCFISSGGANGGIKVLSAASSWVEVSELIPTNTWGYIKICAQDGYAASGTTYIAVYNSTDNNLLRNESIPKVAMSKLSLAYFDGVGSTPNIFYDNIRAWNRTTYGTSPPQAAAVIVQNQSNYTWVNNTPLNNTYTFNTTPMFFFNITGITGSWNYTLWYNNTNVGTLNSVTTTGLKNISASARTTGIEHFFSINQTESVNASNIGVSGWKQIYVAGTCAAGNATMTKTCTFSAGSIALSTATGCI